MLQWLGKWRPRKRIQDISLLPVSVVFHHQGRGLVTAVIRRREGRGRLYQTFVYILVFWNVFLLQIHFLKLPTLSPHQIHNLKCQGQLAVINVGNE